jgi:hypothetical protein
MMDIHSTNVSWEIIKYCGKCIVEETIRPEVTYSGFFG